MPKICRGVVAPSLNRTVRVDPCLVQPAVRFRRIRPTRSPAGPSIPFKLKLRPGGGTGASGAASLLDSSSVPLSCCQAGALSTAAGPGPCRGAASGWRAPAWHAGTGQPPPYQPLAVGVCTCALASSWPPGPRWGSSPQIPPGQVDWAAAPPELQDRAFRPGCYSAYKPRETTAQCASGDYSRYYRRR